MATVTQTLLSNDLKALSSELLRIDYIPSATLIERWHRGDPCAFILLYEHLFVLHSEAISNEISETLKDDFVLCTLSSQTKRSAIALYKILTKYCDIHPCITPQQFMEFRFPRQKLDMATKAVKFIRQKSRKPRRRPPPPPPTTKISLTNNRSTTRSSIGPQVLYLNSKFFDERYSRTDNSIRESATPIQTISSGTKNKEESGIKNEGEEELIEMLQAHVSDLTKTVGVLSDRLAYLEDTIQRLTSHRPTSKI